MFEKLQGRIDELQARRGEEVKEKSRREVLEMEGRLERLEGELERGQRREQEQEQQLRRLERENSSLKENVKKVEGQIVQVQKCSTYKINLVDPL